MNMNRLNLWLSVGLIAALPLISGCEKPAGAAAKVELPAIVEKIEGSDLSRVTLTESAMRRLGVETAAATEGKSPRTESRQTAVPYAALLYDPQGNTWVYTSPQARVFVRASVDVDFIQNDVAYLKSGPAPGTNVATVGVAELYGTEFTVGH
jgi:hypothetical protein